MGVVLASLMGLGSGMGIASQTGVNCLASAMMLPLLKGLVSGNDWGQIGPSLRYGVGRG
ncbi:hypothetical protein ACPUYX_19495 [Desulfosporosinus sp. SYSU MS00001]|uniref:hypothetical protein n=1 Tax=Desulfosporosinus sp. SYSU MS00001 TaxID=3416284 RepID=UPI003CF3FE3E